ncbi:MAG TPA: oxidoreductase [Frankiaceae bacterium]|nr:oxidoreductase [Frankiaceae bacterium]
MDPLAPLMSLPGVADAAEAARQSVDRLLTHTSMRRHGTQVAVEAGLRCARASAALEGRDVPLDVLRATPPEDPVVQGALRVAAELRPLVETWEHAPFQALARMHTLAAAGLAEGESLGRPVPEAGDRLATLASVVAATSVPAVVVAGVVHGELLALRPFGSADGVVARGAARVVLVSRGLDPRAVTAPDVGVVQDPVGYSAAAAAFAAGDVAPFLRLWCGAVAHGAVEGVAIGEALLRG